MADHQSFHPIDQRLFVRSSRLESMQPPPIRIEWAPRRADVDTEARDDLVALIDFPRLNETFQNFLEVTGLPIAIIDLQGKVLASSKWQRLCVDFHRAHPETRTRCIASDILLSQQMQEGKDYAIYRCANGLMDCATPIVIEGVHVANLFTGQFLRSAPDLDYFRRQQAAFGFDEVSYFEALSDIPIVVEEKIPSVLRLLQGLAQQIAKQSLAEKRALAALDTVEQAVAERTREVREAEMHFRALFEGSPVGQVIIDPETLRILECNRAAANVYGYSPEELKQFRVVDFDVVHDDSALAAIQAEILANGQATFERQVRRRDGEIRHLVVTVVLLRSAQGNRYHATHIDVTEQKRVAQAQEKASRALRLLTECNDALLHAEDEQRLLNDICRLIVETGGYLMAWVGFADQDTGKRVRPVARSGYEKGYLDSVEVSWGDTASGQGPVGAAIRTGATQVIQDCFDNPRFEPWRERALQRGYQSMVGLPLKGNADVQGAIAVYAREPGAFAEEEVRLLEKLADNLAFGIEALRARIRLANANRELQGFTYAASHDIKGPLGRIATFSALLEKQYRDRLEGDGLHFLDFIRQNSNRLIELVDALLIHSQMEQRLSCLGRVDLEAAVRGVLNELTEDIKHCGARVELDIAPAVVQANYQSLAQALRNLLSNALKYASQATPPIIEIGGVHLGNRYRLWVKDNGIGFDMAYRGKIFEIFRRLHTYNEYPGSGIGLALVKKAMEAMGGKVWAESEPGRGATFFLEFQRAV